MDEIKVNKKEVIRALSISLLIALVSIGVLVWYYHRLEKDQLPALEQKLEKSLAENALDKFMELRIGQNEERAMLYLTEGAVEQKNQGEFVLVNSFDSYEVLSGEETPAGGYRFVVKIYEEGGLIDVVEIINLIKVSDRYYVDSVEMAG